MRKVLFMFMIILGTTLMYSQNTKTLLSADDNEVTIKFTMNDYNLVTVQTPNGQEVIIKANEASELLLAGAPDLVKMTSSFILPDLGNSTIEVVSEEYQDFENISVAPSKGNLTRDIDPNLVPYEYGKQYTKDAFFPGKLADAGEPYIMRDYRGQAVYVYPFQYNPVSKTLRVYSEITIKVSFTKDKGFNEFNRTTPLTKVNYEFNQIYKNHFINFQQINAKYTPVEEEGRMLIICYDDFMDEMADFVDWKNTIGRPTEIVAVSTIGNNYTSIKTYVTNYYNEDASLAYLLLVGDAAQVTPITRGLGGDSDNGYAYITGSDHYLEFFVGRFSAENAAQVTTQVQRTLIYENGSTLADGWLNVSTGVASAQGPGDDDEYDYQHIRNIQNQLVDFTYDETYNEIYDGSQGDFDASGDATATQVSTAVNDGTGIINYTGHGSETSWGSSGFSVTNINSLTNDNKLPFIFDVACSNGAFNDMTCFGEAWLRATNGSNPTGAIAICASTISQSWDPPMAGQDEMVDILTESYVNNIKRSFAGLVINGCHLMNDEYADFDMTDTWTCFGDPSLLVRTDDPADMTITHNDVVLFGASTFDVNCDFDGALATISKDGVIIGSEYVVGGVASIDVSTGLNSGDEVTLAVIGFNKVTYLIDLMVIAPSGPYVVIESALVNSQTSVNYAETSTVDVTLKNIGPETATGVTANITTTDQYVTEISNNTGISFGDIAANDGTSVADFSVTIANDVPDGYVISFDIEISDNVTKNVWTSSFNLTANAPSFTIGTMTLSGDDDGNGRLEPGETANLTFVVNNTGHADANYITNELIGNSPFFSITNNTIVNQLNAQSSADVIFSVIASEGTPQGTVVDLTFDVYKDVYTAQSTEELTIGIPAEIVVGTGTQESGGYPFYTYYENNKSQMLFLGSELGAGEIVIQDIAFDFINTDNDITSLTNLTIKFKETTMTSLGSAYPDMTGATTVLSSASYTMPQTNGWYVFDTDNFTFDASQNLIIEIVWGDNNEYGSYDNEYKLNCTSTAFTSVTYGYADDETPPIYDGNSSVRPNVTFYFESQVPGTEYVANFTVTDGSNPITGATVIVGTLGQTVDGSGQTTFDLYEGTYYYTATANGYQTISNVEFVVDGNEDITIEMVPGDVTEIANRIQLYPNPTDGLLNIDIDNFVTADFVITDLLGKVVLKSSITKTNTQVDLSNLSNGVYIISINIDGKISQAKVVLK